MKKSHAAFLFLLGSMLSIQYGASLAKGLFSTIGPVALTTLRVVFSALILLILYKPWRSKLGSSYYQTAAYYGVSLGLMNLLFYLSLQRIPLGIAVAVEFVGPLAVAIYYSKSKRDFLWVILAAIGIYLLLPKNNLDFSKQLGGIILAALAGVCWGLYIIFGNKLSRMNPSSGINTSVGMAFAGLTVLPVGMIYSAATILNPYFWLTGFLIAILSSALPYTLEMKALSRLNAKTFGVLMSMEPAVASLMGFLFLHEVLQANEWAGIACVIMASAGVTVTATVTATKKV